MSNNQAIGIVDIGLCNLRSVSKAVYNLGFDFEFVASPEALASVSHCILPGVGAFAIASKRLQQADMLDALKAFAASGKPTLGVCLGMQLLADSGEEGGGAPGLGLIGGSVLRMPSGASLRVPHVGWNAVETTRNHAVFQGIKPKRDFYFVHSYHFVVQANEDALGYTDYGDPFVSAVAKNNVVGFQFHPEKSQANGLKLLENFCNWDGQC